MKRWIILSLLGFFLATGVAVAQADAGAFDKLSPGNQKIAQALYDAQTSKNLSRDDIASMKKDGQGWGEVFKDMKSRGLVQERNLGEVVSRSNHPGESVGNSGVTTPHERGRNHGGFDKGKPETSTSPRKGWKNDDTSWGSSSGKDYGNGFGRGGGGGHGRGGGRGK